MKSTIEVKSRKEAEQLKLGLADDAVRAFVCIMGILSTLPTTRAKARVLHFVEDHFDELGDKRNENSTGGPAIGEFRYE